MKYIWGEKMRKIQKNVWERKQMVIIIICFSLLLGIILGAIGANTMNELQYHEIGNYLSGFFHTLKENKLSEKEGFSYSFIKYEKYVMLIWLCGFIPPGIIAIILLLFFRGLGLGFTTAVMIKEYGNFGAVLSSVSYLPQNIIMIPVLVTISYIAIEYILKKFTYGSPKSRLKREKQKIMIEYCIVFAISGIFVAIAAGIESYFIPIFMEKIVGFIK